MNGGNNSDTIDYFEKFNLKINMIMNWKNPDERGNCWEIRNTEVALEV